MVKKQTRRTFLRKEIEKPAVSERKDSVPLSPCQIVFKGIGRILDALKNSSKFRPGIRFNGHLEKVVVQQKDGVPHVSFTAVSYIPVQQVLSSGTRKGNTPKEVLLPGIELPKPGSYKVMNLQFEHDRKTGTVTILEIPETKWHPIRA